MNETIASEKSQMLNVLKNLDKPRKKITKKSSNNKNKTQFKVTNKRLM